MKLAIIPARGGSKRIPNKNIRPFHGQPIISYSIKAALESNVFDQVIVSTDSQDIADIATELGASVPFMRPEHLCDDFVGIIEVINHAIAWCDSHIHKVVYAGLIYATAPFVTAESLKDAFDILIENECDYVLSMTQFSFPIQRALKLDEQGRIDMFYPEHKFTRSQDLQQAYHDAGQFCLGKADAFLNKQVIYSTRTLPYLLPEYQVQDIDTEEDWVQAELLYKVLKEK